MGPVRRGRISDRCRSRGHWASAGRGARRGARFCARTWWRGWSNPWLGERSSLPVGEDHPADPALATGEEAAQQAHLSWKHLWWTNRCRVDAKDSVPDNPLTLTLKDESVLRIDLNAEARRRAAQVGKSVAGEPCCNIKVES